MVRNTDIERAVGGIERDGFTLLEEVIPAAEIGSIRNDVVAAQARHHEESEALKNAIRKAGHRVGVEGVASMRGVINKTQSFAPYLVDERVIGVARHFFGEHIRISCTDCVVNLPDCGRGYWHADWPYNQTNASRIPTPYPQAVLHLSSIWMISDFNTDNGGTLLVPGSHRVLQNPSSAELPDVDRDAPYPTEVHATGWAGSVLMYDSRLWHAVPSNNSDEARVALIIRFAPWWLSLEPTRPNSPEHTAMVVEAGGKDYASPLLKAEVFTALPEAVKPLYRHWVEEGAPSGS
ncbi:MAG: phytanoyl-CoA dioxygenase family protein [Candidatus Latescibacterota bacterium]|nr:phytanoyl-CoA dioxygenase family protein [Candidatus Latescibacterota bacterium]